MNPIRLLVFAALLIFSSTAATCTKTGGGGNPVVAGVVNCAEQAVHDAALHVIDDAASALATGNWEAALADLVMRFGEGAVDCAVAEIADTATAHARFDELEATKAKRARQWLAAHPVRMAAREVDRELSAPTMAVEHIEAGAGDLLMVNADGVPRFSRGTDTITLEGHDDGSRLLGQSGSISLTPYAAIGTITSKPPECSPPTLSDVYAACDVACGGDNTGLPLLDGGCACWGGRRWEREGRTGRARGKR